MLHTISDDQLDRALHVRDLTDPREGEQWDLQMIKADQAHRITEGNRKAAEGPPLNLTPFDTERVLRTRRRRQ